MKIEGYLSQKIQGLYPKAIVVMVGDKYILRQSPVSDDIELGDNFQQAKMAIFALLRADLPLLSQHHVEGYNLLASLIEKLKSKQYGPFSIDRSIYAEFADLISKSEKVFAAEQARIAKKAK